MKRNILKLSVVAFVVTALLIVGSVFAFGSASAPQKELKLLVSTSSGAVEAGEEFTVTVKLADADITEFKLAGVQVQLAFDTTAVTATKDNVVVTLDEEESTAVYNVKDGSVNFVCVKNDFTDTEGYTALTDLFTVTFTANKNISNPAALFTEDDITLILGDTMAKELKDAEKFYGGDKLAIANAILNSELELVISETAGTVVVAPTPKAGAGAAENSIEGATVENTVAAGKIGTGAIFSIGGESAVMVVKGDLDGDGVVTVFDATMIKKEDKSAAQELASDVNDVAGIDANDSQTAVDHVVGNTEIK